MTKNKNQKNEYSTNSQNAMPLELNQFSLSIITTNTQLFMLNTD